jgi:hypothetical protein
VRAAARVGWDNLLAASRAMAVIAVGVAAAEVVAALKNLAAAEVASQLPAAEIAARLAGVVDSLGQIATKALAAGVVPRAAWAADSPAHTVAVRPLAGTVVDYSVPSAEAPLAAS